MYRNFHNKGISLLLIFSMILTIFVSAVPSIAAIEESQVYLDSKELETLEKLVSQFNNEITGEEAFDYTSYLYLGWRTTGGPWQNEVINNFIVNKLKDSDFKFSDRDMSKDSNDDYVWVQQDDSEGIVWAPEFASLNIISDNVDKNLADKFNVDAYGFDPTSEIYKEYYEIDTIDEMYDWITEKDGSGRRVNVGSKKESDLNKRCHLATNSGFTDPKGTRVEDAKGIEGEVVYIGEVKSEKIGGETVYYGTETKLEGNDSLEGKILFSDTSNSRNFELAKQVGAKSIMTTAALSSYSNPTIDGEVWYKDSARYARGTTPKKSYDEMESGNSIVIWNLSLNQEEAMHEILKEAGDKPVIAKATAIGGMYPMTIADKGNNGSEGQLTGVAEIAGTTKAHERVVFVAHVQEPGANDNATGVGLSLELVTKLKEMIDSGEIERPERTMTFLWGDEMEFSQLWLDAHPEEKENVVCVINLDMVGEDTEKTGGPMRIEKTPDPSAIYRYTQDVVPGEDPFTNEYRKDVDEFIRMPDSHTLWGEGNVPDIKGLYLNDLYMASTQEVIRSVDPTFEVAVCPYEGGSDHTIFLNAGLPAILTWHFTDYVYHTSVDTMDKVSVSELKNVGITSIAAGYMAAIAEEEESMEMMQIMVDAASDRFKLEIDNTEGHIKWAKENGKNLEEALELEVEILNAWGTWYEEAIESCQSYFVGENASDELLNLKTNFLEEVKEMTKDATSYAESLWSGKDASDSSEVNYYMEPDYELKYDSNEVRANIEARNHVRSMPQKFKVKVGGILYELIKVNEVFSKDSNNWKDLLTE